MVTVSVIIPNYNRATVIGDTLESMLRQTLPPHEVIVVDDGSTDDSVEVIQQFGDRLTLVQQSNKGPGAARNAGLKQATGEFIQFMDSDDLASLNKLEVQSKTLIQHQADIVYGPWAKAWIGNGQIRLQNVVLQRRSLPNHRHPLLWFLTSWSMVFQQCLVRRSALQRVGGYREDLRLYEDGDLFVRLLLSGATLIHEAETLTLYRLDDHGKLTASGQKSHQKAADTIRFYEAVIDQLSQHNQYQIILTHPEFRLNLWRACQSCPECSRHPYLHEADSTLMKVRDRLQQIQKGAQQRLKGHRWPACYQPAAIIPQQHQLIHDLGLTLI